MTIKLIKKSGENQEEPGKNKKGESMKPTAVFAGMTQYDMHKKPVNIE